MFDEPIGRCVFPPPKRRDDFSVAFEIARAILRQMKDGGGAQPIRFEVSPETFKALCIERDCLLTDEVTVLDIPVVAV